MKADFLKVDINSGRARNVLFVGNRMWTYDGNTIWCSQNGEQWEASLTDTGKLLGFIAFKGRVWCIGGGKQSGPVRYHLPGSNRWVTTAEVISNGIKTLQPMDAPLCCMAVKNCIWIMGSSRSIRDAWCSHDGSSWQWVRI